jgi:hypothetical protein
MTIEPRLVALLIGWLSACAGDEYLLGHGRTNETMTPPVLRPSAMDAGQDAGAAPSGAHDAGAGPTSPPPLGTTYGTPVAISALAGPDGKDDDPTFARDRTMLFFNSTRTGGVDREDIWVTTRASIGAPFTAPAPVMELNTDARETGIAVSPDGLTIWFSSDRDGGPGGLDVYVASRSAHDATFGPARLVNALSSARDDLVSAVDPTLTSIYLARRDDDDDDYDLFVAERSDTQREFNEPRPLDALNTDDEESDALAANAGNTLVFTREGDLRIAVRHGPGQPFVEQTALGELNSARDDRDCWASEDLRYVIFSSNRTGTYLLYEATR